MDEAGSLPLVALTAWQALVERGRVQAGHKVLIHAGAGGVGSIAIQLAKHLGATVATTTSGADAEFVRGLGAPLTALIDDGALRPIVGRVVPFDQTVQTLQGLERGGIRGKAVMTNP